VASVNVGGIVYYVPYRWRCSSIKRCWLATQRTTSADSVVPSRSRSSVCSSTDLTNSANSGASCCTCSYTPGNLFSPNCLEHVQWRSYRRFWTRASDLL